MQVIMRIILFDKLKLCSFSEKNLLVVWDGNSLWYKVERGEFKCNYANGPQYYLACVLHTILYRCITYFFMKQ